MQLNQPWQIYYLSWVLCLIVLLISTNLLRTPTGRAMLAIRDSEIAARSSGIRVARIKGIAFGLSAAFAGLAGALYSHALGFISPDQFTISMSLDLLVMILIGGLGTLRGVLFGAVFLVVSPELFQQLIGLFTSGNTEVAGLRPFLFGVLLILVLMFQPNGIDAIVTRIGEWPARLIAVAEALTWPCWKSEDLTLQFGGLKAVDGVSFQRQRRRDIGNHRSQRGGQDDHLQHGKPHLHAEPRQHHFCG